ncbi:hypothetical protein FSP39_024890 [Pinctada imbricata]|uniref:Uncharacterized protein n=1 Tax=Pinctada imbricata TaxID=66713 RepID=A0AA88YGB7_PINIB|nr:hypothetical protein FSP39_024890 [Pinctada imbricata]
MGNRCRLRTAICHVNSRRCGYPGLRAHNPLTSPVIRRSRRTYSCGVNQPPHLSGLCPKLSLNNGRSDIRMKGRIIYYYCNKGYQLIGYRTAKCILNTWNKPLPTCVASGCDVRLTISNGVVVQTLNGSVLTINCVNDTILQGRNKMYCDGHQWHIPAPRCTAPENINSCDFENGGYCGWEQDTDDDFDWSIRSGETPTARTGPVYDHTYGQRSGGGHYIYMEASAPRQSGHTTRLLSPVYPPEKSDRCLQFWYHMLGPSSQYAVGTLNLNIIHDVEFSSNISNLWSISGNQGKQWKVADIYIGKTNYSFKLQLEAVRQMSYVSDIAVDDILFYNCVPATSLPTTEAELKTSAMIKSSTESIEETTPTSMPAIQETTFSSETIGKDRWNIPQSSDHRPRSMFNILIPPEPNGTDQNNNGSDDEITRQKLQSSVPISSNFSLQNDTTDIEDYTSSNNQNITSAVQDTSENVTEVIPTEKATSDVITTSYETKLQTTLKQHSSTKDPMFHSSSNTRTILDDSSSEISEALFPTTAVHKKSEVFKEKDLSSNGTSPHIDFVHVDSERTTILNLCISLSVVSIFTAVLILFIALCRRRQRKYEKKYQEMKLFVETHYRNRYI